MTRCGAPALRPALRAPLRRRTSVAGSAARHVPRVVTLIARQVPWWQPVPDPGRYRDISEVVERVQGADDPARWSAERGSRLGGCDPRTDLPLSAHGSTGSTAEATRAAFEARRRIEARRGWDRRRLPTRASRAGGAGRSRRACSAASGCRPPAAPPARPATACGCDPTARGREPRPRGRPPASSGRSAPALRVRHSRLPSSAVGIRLVAHDEQRQLAERLVGDHEGVGAQLGGGKRLDSRELSREADAASPAARRAVSPRPSDAGRPWRSSSRALWRARGRRRGRQQATVGAGQPHRVGHPGVAARPGAGRADLPTPGRTSAASSFASQPSTRGRLNEFTKQ